MPTTAGVIVVSTTWFAICGNLLSVTKLVYSVVVTLRNPGTYRTRTTNT